MRNAQARETELLQARGKLASLQTDLHYVLGVGSEAFAREDPDPPGELTTLTPLGETVTLNLPTDQMLTRAMQWNPDIRLAKARLRGAQAGLHRTRLGVARKVLTLKDSIAQLNRRVKILREGYANGEVMETVLIEAIADRSAADAEMDYLIGGPSLADLEGDGKPSTEAPEKK